MRAYTSLILTATFVLVLTGCATPAAETGGQELAEAPGTQAAQPAAPEAAATGPRVRECRYAKSTGSKMRTRICRPQEEWARIDAATDQGQNTDAFFRTMRENAATGASGGLNAP